MTGRWHYYLDTRLLSLFGLLAALPLIVGGYLIAGSARVTLDESIGRNFVWLSEHAANSVDQAISQEILHLVALSASPDLIRAAGGANRAPVGEAAAQALDQKWSQLASDDPRVKRLGEAEASRHLREIVSTTPLYQELLLLDATGVVVAASGRPRRYYFGRRPWFQKAMTGVDDGWLSINVQRDPDLEADVVAMAWPVRDSGQPVGVLRAVLDARTLFAPVAGLRFGNSGHAALFNQKDGTILAGSGTAFQGAYPRLEEYRRAVDRGLRYFVAGPGSPGAELVGYARPQLAASYAHLDWVVTVQQSLRDARAPVGSLTRDLVLYVLGMGATVLALALYLSFKLEKPVTEVELEEIHHGVVSRT